MIERFHLDLHHDQLLEEDDQMNHLIKKTDKDEGLQNSFQQDSEFYTEQQNLNNSQGQLLA
jgi:hypothetical protein